MAFSLLVCALGFLSLTNALNIVVGNDDGWAIAQVRALKNTLDGAGYNTLLSAPAVDKSGTASSDAPATTLTSACEFDTCPAGSPAEGFNASDPSLNYVNSFPVTSIRFGIQTLAPKFFNGSLPDLVLCGPNNGQNLGHTASDVSGTVGATAEAALEGIPSIAFSGKSGSFVSYTTIEPGDVPSIYAAVSLKVVETLIAAGAPFLPPGIGLNVNYPAATGACTDPSAYKFVLTRILPDPTATDVTTCGTDHLPDESTVESSTTTCQSTISVFNATGKVDVGADTQAVVLKKLQSILSCA